MIIDELIRSEMEKPGASPDPVTVAKGLVPQSLQASDFDEFLEWALAQRVANHHRLDRVHIETEPSTGPGPSRWSKYREVAPFINKFVDELTVSDLTDIVERYKEMAASANAKGAQYQALLDELKASGFATVGELVHPVRGRATRSQLYL